MLWGIFINDFNLKEDYMTYRNNLFHDFFLHAFKVAISDQLFKSKLMITSYYHLLNIFVRNEEI